MSQGQHYDSSEMFLGGIFLSSVPIIQKQAVRKEWLYGVIVMEHWKKNKNI